MILPSFRLCLESKKPLNILFHHSGQFLYDKLEQICYDGYSMGDACTPDKSGILECGEGTKYKIRVKECGLGHECAKCERDDYNEHKCRCVDNTKRPSFPR